MYKILTAGRFLYQITSKRCNLLNYGFANQGEMESKRGTNSVDLIQFMSALKQQNESN